MSLCELDRKWKHLTHAFSFQRKLTKRPKVHQVPSEAYKSRFSTPPLPTLPDLVSLFGIKIFVDKSVANFDELRAELWYSGCWDSNDT